LRAQPDAANAAPKPGLRLVKPQLGARDEASLQVRPHSR
jgi:hypothetical protein